MCSIEQKSFLGDNARRLVESDPPSVKPYSGLTPPPFSAHVFRQGGGRVNEKRKTKNYFAFLLSAQC